MDSQRANMLAFQSIKIPQNFLLISNQDACVLPDSVQFDKVLCDVPCSGDGTIRKNDSKLIFLI
jgi:16S rRNA C967 or C1407 C5-methylase (RsmB/RsmF family)